MNPEQRFFVILEYFTVEFQILFLRTVIRMLCPKRNRLIKKFRPPYDFQFLLVFLFLLRNLLHHRIGIQLFFCLYNLGFLCILLLQINLGRHEGTIFLNDFPCLVLIAELQTIFIDMERNLRPYFRPGTFFHVELGAAVAYPMHRHRIFFIRQRINMHLIRYHKCGIET